MAGTAPTAIGSFSHGWNFGALTTGDSDGGTAAAAYESGIKSFSAGGTSTIPDTAAGSNALTVSGAKVWLAGTGAFRGISVRASTGGTVFPDGSQGNSPVRGIASKTTGTSLNCKDCWTLIVWSGSVRSTDDQLSGVERAFLCDIGGGKLNIWTNTDNLMGYDDGTTIRTSAQYAHAGINAMVVRSNATNVRMRVANGAGTSTESTLAAAASSGSSATFHAMTSSSSSSYANLGRCMGIWTGTDGSLSDANADAMLLWAEGVYGIIPFTQFAAFLGDSFTTNYYGIPGSSIPAQFAQAHRNCFVYNAAHTGATLQTGGTPSIMDTQVLRARQALFVHKPTGSIPVAHLLGGANDMTARTGANMKSDIDTIVTNLKSAGDADETPFIKVVVATPVSRVQAGVNDASKAATEANAASLASLLAAASYDGKVDLKAALSTPASGSAADLKTMVYGNQRWRVPIGLTKLISPATSIIGGITISGCTQANPTVITQAQHGLSTGDEVKVQVANNVPATIINAVYTATSIDENTYSIPLDLSATTVTGANGYGDRQSADGVHLNIQGQKEMYALIDRGIVSAVPALATSGGGFRSRSRNWRTR